MVRRVCRERIESELKQGVRTVVHGRRTLASHASPQHGRTHAKDRAEVERLSGQCLVPILVLDSGEVIAGSGHIVK